MPTPRAQLISLQDTPWYHCVSRCVRRAFLCGDDELTGRSYEHRREWVEARVLTVSRVFAIDVASYAIMSNHYHLVLRVDSDSAALWSTEDVIDRWHELFNGSLLSRKYRDCPQLLGPAETAHVKERAEVWRARLMDISWFMRCVNEQISRRANAEDHCTGAFWEARFKSQALLDEQAVLSAMAYVDLNPVRAGIADTPETSEHTSIQRRIASVREGDIPADLLRFQGNEYKDNLKGIPFGLQNYIELVDWTGRVVRRDKRNAIDARLPPILSRLEIDEETWLAVATQFEQCYRNWVGSEAAIQDATHNVGRTRSRSPPLALHH